MLKFLHMDRHMQGHTEAARHIFPTICPDVPKRKYPIISEILCCKIILSHYMSYIDRIHKLPETLKPILHMPHPNHYTNSNTCHTSWWLWNSPGGSQWLCWRLCESSSRIWVTRQELWMGWCFHFYIFLWVTSWWCSSQTRYFLWDCFTAHP